MNRSSDLLLATFAAVCLGAAVWSALPQPPPAPPKVPVPAPVPDQPKPKPKPKPWGEQDAAPVGAGVGRVAPDGTEPQIDLPNALHRRNTSSRGLGNCVFTSIHHSALWADVPQLQEFPKWLIDHGIPGGGYPGKVADLIPKMCADRKMPVPNYLQVEGNDLEILKLACKTGRMPAVTYSVSPTGRYGGGHIAHMVSLAHADDKWFAVLDNNYPGAENLEWMTPQQFLRAYSPGWCVVLLEPGPPPAPVGIHRADNGETFAELRNRKDDTMLALIYCAALCGPPGPDCDSCKPSAPAEPVIYGGYRWDQKDPEQWILWDSAGKQIGNHWHKGPYAGQFRRLTASGWSEPCDPPQPLPGSEPAPGPDRDTASNFGVAKEMIHKGPAYSIKGQSVTRKQAMDALKNEAGDPKIPDDSTLPRLTIVGGTEAERVIVRSDLDSSPSLAQWKGKLNVKSYPADHWAVAGTGFATGGHPTIYLQEPSGKVLHRQDDYTGGAEALATAIRKADPNYQPAADPDKRKSPLIPMSIPPWALTLPGALVGFALPQRKG